MGINKKFIALENVKGKFTFYKVMQIIWKVDFVPVLFTVY